MTKMNNSNITKEADSLFRAIREVYGNGWFGRLQLIDIIQECGYDHRESHALYRKFRRSNLIEEDGGIVFVH